MDLFPREPNSLYPDEAGSLASTSYSTMHASNPMAMARLAAHLICFAAECEEAFLAGDKRVQLSTLRGTSR